MKPSQLLLTLGSFILVSCQGMVLPWNRGAATTAATGTGYDAANQWAQQGTGYQNQYQNTGYTGAPAAPQQNWSAADGAQAYPTNNATGAGWDAGSTGQDYSQASSTAAANTYTPPSSGGGNYTVKKGDTLYALASRNGTSVNKLMSLNGLSSSNIRIGQRLRMP